MSSNYRKLQINKIIQFKQNPFFETIKEQYLNKNIKSIREVKKLFSLIKLNKNKDVSSKTDIQTQNNLFKLLSTKPLYNEIKNLKDNNKITLLNSINILRKLKLTKKNILDKRSSKNILKLINDNSKKLKDDIVGKRSVKIDINKINIDNYNQTTHLIEFQKIKKKYPNKLYRQTLKFYNDKDQLINDKLSFKDEDSDKIYETDFRNREFITTNPNKNFMSSLYFNVTSTNSDFDYMWLCSILVNFYNEKYYSIIETEAINFVEVKKNQNKQTYKNNDSGTCVYDAFLKFFLYNKDKNAKTISNKLISSEGLKYKKAYNDDNLKEICKFCNTSLYIRDIVKGPKYDKKIITDFAKFKINMVNSKYNHLDLLLSNDEEEEVENIKELELIKQKTPFYVEKFGKVQTIDKIYKVRDDDFKQCFKKWKETYNLSNKYIYEDSNEDKLIDTYDYNLHSFFNNEWEAIDSDYKEIDLKKAYYNYTDKQYNKHYHGVPSGKFINISCDDKFNIDLFNELTNNSLIGYYQVKITDIKNKRSHMDKLGFSINTIHTLTSANINLLKDYLEFKFINASYSTSCHIPFINEEESFLRQIDKVKHYCKAFGILVGQKNETVINIKPLEQDEQYYNIIDDDNFKINNYEGKIQIRYKDEERKTYRHIALYIHSYTRTLILEQLLKMDIDMIYGVKLDSIVYKKEYKIENINNIFHHKPSKIEKLLFHKNIGNDLEFGTIDYKENEDEDDSSSCGFFRNYFEENNNILSFPSTFLQTSDIVKNKIVFIGGAGGSGKSYSVLKNNNINPKNICYTTNCWNLIQGQKQKYNNILGYSNPNLTGNCNGKAVEKIRNNDIKYIVIDELTLIDNKVIKQIIKEYNECFIFLLGDIEEDGNFFQCSLPSVRIFKPNEKNYNIQYVKYTKSYRFDNNLKNKLDSLRLWISDNLHKETNKLRYLKNSKKIIDYVKSNFDKCFYNKEDVIYNNEDVGISGTHKENLTEYFINKGTTKKYYCKQTDKRNLEFKGQEINQEEYNIKKNKSNWELKLFKTIHSFQGLDLNDNNKIIISIDKNFDVNLFYTALSRAKREDQIYILN